MPKRGREDRWGRRRSSHTHAAWPYQPSLGTVPASTLRQETVDLLSVAAEIAALANGDGELPEERLELFLDKYRAWILDARDMSRDRQDWVVRHSILMHLMVSGSTLGEAVTILARFAEPVWGSQTRFELVDEGETIALVVHEPLKPGPEGVISALWLLSSTVCQLEFLVGQKLDNISGHLRNERCTPQHLEEFLFGWPIEFGAAESAIRIPKADLDRLVVVTTAQLPSFLKGFMRRTVNVQRQHSTAENVSNILWRSATRRSGIGCGMKDVASKLGLSESTLRRRLMEEDATFSAIKIDVYDRLAKTWLRETDQTVEQIAERLGYSDGFAFRRAFRSRNGIPPQRYRTCLKS